jgi:hypothetical protein
LTSGPKKRANAMRKMRTRRPLSPNVKRPGDNRGFAGPGNVRARNVLNQRQLAFSTDWLNKPQYCVFPTFLIFFARTVG